MREICRLLSGAAIDNKQSGKAPHSKVKMNENSLGKFQLHFPDHCTCMLAGTLHLKQLAVF
jgi:hypothetical protein